MDKVLRPERLDTDPNSGTAAKEWLHWRRTFENFMAVFFFFFFFFLLLRSRGTRERILIWFRRREKSRFCGLQIGRPSTVLQGLWASFSFISRLSSFNDAYMTSILIQAI